MMGSQTGVSRAEFEMAMMSWKDWEASWITPEYDYTAPKTACPIIRKEFQVRKKIAKARVYVTAKGLYELRLNGEKWERIFLHQAGHPIIKEHYIRFMM